MTKYLVRESCGYQKADASGCLPSDAFRAWLSSDVVVFDEDCYGWLDYLMGFPFMEALGFEVIEGDVSGMFGMGDEWFDFPDCLVDAILLDATFLPAWLERAVDPWYCPDVIKFGGENNCGFRELSVEQENAYYSNHIRATCEVLVDRGGLSISPGEACVDEFKRVIIEELRVPLRDGDKDVLLAACVKGAVSVARLGDFLDVLDQCVDAIESGVPAEDVFA